MAGGVNCKACHTCSIEAAFDGAELKDIDPVVGASNDGAWSRLGRVLCTNYNLVTRHHSATTRRASYPWPIILIKSIYIFGTRGRRVCGAGDGAVDALAVGRDVGRPRRPAGVRIVHG